MRTLSSAFHFGTTLSAKHLLLASSAFTSRPVMTRWNGETHVIGQPWCMAPLRHHPSEVHAHLKQNWCTIFRFIYLKEDETQKNFSSPKRRSTFNTEVHTLYINQSFNQINGLFTYRLVSYCSRNDGHSLKKSQRENTSVWLHLKRKKAKRTLSINKTSATILNYLVLQWKKHVSLVRRH